MDNIGKITLWLAGVIVSAIIAWQLNFISNPWKCNNAINDLDIRIYHSERTKTLALKIKKEINGCVNSFKINDHSYDKSYSDVRFYREEDRSKAKIVLDIVNDLTAEYVLLNVAFKLNSRVGEVNEVRNNRIHIYIEN